MSLAVYDVPYSPTLPLPSDIPQSVFAAVGGLRDGVSRVCVRMRRFSRVCHDVMYWQARHPATQDRMATAITGACAMWPLLDG